MKNIYELKNGNIFVVAETAGGVYSSDQIRNLCDIADNETAFLKVTEDQRIGFMLSPESFPDVQKKLTRNGIFLRHHRAQGYTSTKACLGLLCPYSQQDALGDALEVATKLNNKYTDLPWAALGISGCSKACTASALDDFHIVGENSGYTIYIGGKTSDEPKLSQLVCENISPLILPQVIDKLLETFQKNRKKQETIHDVVERLGIGIFITAADEAINAQDVKIAEESHDDDLSSFIEENENKILENQEENTLAASQGMSENDELSLEIDDNDLKEEKVLKNDELLTDEDSQDLALLEDESLDADILKNDNLETETSAQQAEELEIQDSESDSLVLDDDNQDYNHQELNTEEDDTLLLENEDTSLELDDKNTITSETTDDKARQESSQEADKNLPQLENLPQKSFEEETDISEYQEATDEDVERMTKEMQTELAFEHTNHGSLPDSTGPEERFEEKQLQELNPTPSISSHTPTIPQDSGETQRNKTTLFHNHHAEPEKPRGKLKVRIEDDAICVILPSGMECELPHEMFENEDYLELEIAEETLVVQRHNNLLYVRYGALQIKLPILSKKTAA